MSADPVVIVAAQRTPIGAFQGVLSPATAPHLGAAAIAGAIADCAVDASDVNQVLMGCVCPPAWVRPRPDRPLSMRESRSALPARP